MLEGSAAFAAKGSFATLKGSGLRPKGSFVLYGDEYRAVPSGGVSHFVLEGSAAFAAKGSFGLRPQGEFRYAQGEWTSSKGESHASRSRGVVPRTR